MTNPMDALVKLQLAIDRGQLTLQPADVYPTLGLWMDEVGGTTRFTFAKVDSGKVQAIAMFVHAGEINAAPCFQTGYAVIESVRQMGLASDLVAKGIEEMRHGLGRHGVAVFYVEAVVGEGNTASHRLATRLISATPERITDAFSGEAALRYLKRVNCSR